MTLKEKHVTHRAKKCIYTCIKSELKKKKITDWTEADDTMPKISK